MLELVLASALLSFRLLGALGVRRFASWPASAAHALAVMLVVTASAHFVPASVTVMPNHADLVRMDRADCCPAAREKLRLASSGEATAR